MRSLPLFALLLLTACTSSLPAPPPPAPTPTAAPPSPGLSSPDFLSLLAHLSLTAESERSRVISGRDGFLFFAPEIHFAAAPALFGAPALTYARAETVADRDPLPAILDFKRQLDQQNVALVLVPVPARVHVYPERLVADAPPSTPRLDQAMQDLFKQLAAEGITVIDLLPRFLAARERELYCYQDSHWSGAGIAVAATAIAEVVRETLWSGEIPRREIQHESREVEITGDLWRDLKPPQPPREQLSLEFVTGADGQPIADDPRSPLVLLGDSHNLVFHVGGELHATGAGLPDQLAKELGFAVDVIAVRGSGSTAARLNLRRRGGVAGKRMVVWCFSAREFSEGHGFRLVPLE